MKPNTYKALDVKFKKGETMTGWLASLKFKITKKGNTIKTGWYAKGDTGE